MLTVVLGVSATPQPINFTEAQRLPPTSNVFVNSSLYGLVSTWSLDSMPMAPPLFNETNGLPLQSRETVFVVSYSCQERRLKSPFSLIITVIAADYALIAGGYTAVIWIAYLIEKRQKARIFKICTQAN
jgi:hypothetical protein